MEFPVALGVFVFLVLFVLNRGDIKKTLYFFGGLVLLSPIGVTVFSLIGCLMHSGSMCLFAAFGWMMFLLAVPIGLVILFIATCIPKETPNVNLDESDGEFYKNNVESVKKNEPSKS